MSFSLICWIGIFFPLHDNILLLFLFCAYLTTLSWFMIPFVIEMAMIIQIEMAMMTIIQKYCLLLFFTWGSIHLSGGGEGIQPRKLHNVIKRDAKISTNMQKYRNKNKNRQTKKKLFQLLFVVAFQPKSCKTYLCLFVRNKVLFVLMVLLQLWPSTL